MARLARAAHELAGRYETAAAGERLVAETLLTLTGRGWRLLVDRQWPGTRAANVDMILVGPGGVFVVDVKNWRAAPEVWEGLLRSGGDDRQGEVGKIHAQARVAENAVAALGLAPVAVQPVLVFCGHRVDQHIGRVRLLGQLDVARALLAQPRRLTTAQIRAVADHLEIVFPAYAPAAVPTPPPMPDPVRRESTPVEAPSLFDIDEIADATLRSALAAPIEGWMTFLHPDQAAQVGRRFGGPARISGPAGTGKTVIGLHRAVYLAQHSQHRVLYVTFANNLPRIARSLVERFAPGTADRIEFTSVHNLANTVLSDAEIPVRLYGTQARSLLTKAWFTVGRHGVLPHLEPNANYWIDEVDYVIKGRGLPDLDRYLAVERRGRRTMLRAEHRRAVWEMYEHYERLRIAAGIHDFNDVLSLAAAAIAEGRVKRDYSAVIVDECQDLTLVGMRLLHGLVGDAANGLLVIGDGQQAVYPGGYRLSEAGVTVAGARGVVLRTNYRNAEEIWNAAMAVVAGDTFEDVDETRATGRRDVETTYREGTVVRVEGVDQAEHDRQLLQALRAHESAWADAAVLCARKKDVEHYEKLLTKAGIPVERLERYEGQQTAACKIGTFHRVKGLEFKHVFLPCHDALLHDTTGYASAAPERAELFRRQLFVAMTRARDTLWLGSTRA